jgi:hypothetical protein
MAAAPKTRPTDASVEAFLAAVPGAGRRTDAQALDALMREVTGEAPVMWGPSIVGYGAYRGSTGDWPVTGFSPRKANMVIYLMPGFEGRSEQLARLGKHKTGKSCLYLGRLADADSGVLRTLVADSVSAVRAKYAG